MSGWQWLGLIALTAVLWLFLRSVRRSSRVAPDGTVARIRGNGRYQAEVVGESYNAAAFETLIERHRVDDLDAEWFGDAMLRLEDANPHDKNAVAVFVEGLQVGHLSRSMAVEFRHAVAQAGFADRHEFAVGARVYWGGQRSRHSVSLDLPQA